MRASVKTVARKQIGVIDAGACGSETRSLAEMVGRGVAKRGAVLLCGGLGGVMEATAYGAKQEGGLTPGTLPGTLREEANPWIDLAVVSGMGHARNALIAQSSDALIAVNGEYGTLSEIALGLKMGKPVVVLDTGWKNRRHSQGKKLGRGRRTCLQADWSQWKILTDQLKKAWKDL